jgi:hypothetical protein
MCVNRRAHVAEKSPTYGSMAEVRREEGEGNGDGRRRRRKN